MKFDADTRNGLYATISDAVITDDHDRIEHVLDAVEMILAPLLFEREHQLRSLMGDVLNAAVALSSIDEDLADGKTFDAQDTATPAAAAAMAAWATMSVPRTVVGADVESLSDRLSRDLDLLGASLG